MSREQRKTSSINSQYQRPVFDSNSYDGLYINGHRSSSSPYNTQHHDTNTTVAVMRRGPCGEQDSPPKPSRGYQMRYGNNLDDCSSSNCSPELQNVPHYHHHIAYDYNNNNTAAYSPPMEKIATTTTTTTKSKCTM